MRTDAIVPPPLPPKNKTALKPKACKKRRKPSSRLPPRSDRGSGAMNAGMLVRATSLGHYFPVLLTIYTDQLYKSPTQNIPDCRPRLRARVRELIFAASVQTTELGYFFSIFPINSDQRDPASPQKLLSQLRDIHSSHQVGVYGKMQNLTVLLSRGVMSMTGIALREIQPYDRSRAGFLCLLIVILAIAFSAFCAPCHLAFCAQIEISIPFESMESMALPRGEHFSKGGGLETLGVEGMDPGMTMDLDAKTRVDEKGLEEPAEIWNKSVITASEKASDKRMKVSLETMGEPMGHWAGNDEPDRKVRAVVDCSISPYTTIFLRSRRGIENNEESAAGVFGIQKKLGKATEIELSGEKESKAGGDIAGFGGKISQKLGEGTSVELAGKRDRADGSMTDLVSASINQKMGQKTSLEVSARETVKPLDEENSYKIKVDHRITESTKIALSRETEETVRGEGEDKSTTELAVKRALGRLGTLSAHCGVTESLESMASVAGLDYEVSINRYFKVFGGFQGYLLDQRSFQAELGLKKESETEDFGIHCRLERLESRPSEYEKRLFIMYVRKF
jgi:hypothetical protein